MIIDASVATKWLVDEPDSARATELLLRTDLSAPDFLDLELANTLGRFARRGLISNESASDLWTSAFSLPVIRFEWQGLASQGLALSLELGAAFYDCLYLALALEQDDVVVTADARFVRAVQSRPALSGRAVLLSDF